MKGTPWAPRREDSQAEVRMPEERHRPMIGWNTNSRMLRDNLTVGCAAYASPGGKKHNVACLNWKEEWKNKTIAQSQRVRRETDAEMQQDKPSSSALHGSESGVENSFVLCSELESRVKPRTLESGEHPEQR